MSKGSRVSRGNGVERGGVNSRVSALQAQSSERGITFVELAVTIVLVAILAGLALTNAGMLRESAFDAAALQDYRHVKLVIEEAIISDALPESFTLNQLTGPQPLPDPFGTISLSTSVRLTNFQIGTRPGAPPRPRPPGGGPPAFAPGPPGGVPPGLVRERSIRFQIEHSRGTRRFRYDRLGEEIVELVLERS